MASQGGLTLPLFAPDVFKILRHNEQHTRSSRKQTHAQQLYPPSPSTKRPLPARCNSPSCRVSPTSHPPYTRSYAMRSSTSLIPRRQHRTLAKHTPRPSSRLCSTASLGCLHSMDSSVERLVSRSSSILSPSSLTYHDGCSLQAHANHEQHLVPHEEKERVNARHLERRRQLFDKTARDDRLRSSSAPSSARNAYRHQRVPHILTPRSILLSSPSSFEQQAAERTSTNITPIRLNTPSPNDLTVPSRSFVPCCLSERRTSYSLSAPSSPLHAKQCAGAEGVTEDSGILRRPEKQRICVPKLRCVGQHKNEEDSSPRFLQSLALASSRVTSSSAPYRAPAPTNLSVDIFVCRPHNYVGFLNSEAELSTNEDLRCEVLTLRCPLPGTTDFCRDTSIQSFLYQHTVSSESLSTLPVLLRGVPVERNTLLVAEFYPVKHSSSSPQCLGRLFLPSTLLELIAAQDLCVFSKRHTCLKSLFRVASYNSVVLEVPLFLCPPTNFPPLSEKEAETVLYKIAEQAATQRLPSGPIAMFRLSRTASLAYHSCLRPSVPQKRFPSTTSCFDTATRELRTDDVATHNPKLSARFHSSGSDKNSVKPYTNANVFSNSNDVTKQSLKVTPLSVEELSHSLDSHNRLLFPTDSCNNLCSALCSRTPICATTAAPPSQLCSCNQNPPLRQESTLHSPKLEINADWDSIDDDNSRCVCSAFKNENEHSTASFQKLDDVDTRCNKCLRSDCSQANFSNQNVNVATRFSPRPSQLVPPLSLDAVYPFNASRDCVTSPVTLPPCEDDARSVTSLSEAAQCANCSCKSSFRQRPICSPLQPHTMSPLHKPPSQPHTLYEPHRGHRPRCGVLSPSFHFIHGNRPWRSRASSLLASKAPHACCKRSAKTLMLHHSPPIPSSYTSQKVPCVMSFSTKGATDCVSKRVPVPVAACNCTVASAQPSLARLTSTLVKPQHVFCKAKKKYATHQCFTCRSWKTSSARSTSKARQAPKHLKSFPSAAELLPVTATHYAQQRVVQCRPTHYSPNIGKPANVVTHQSFPWDGVAPFPFYPKNKKEAACCTASTNQYQGETRPLVNFVTMLVSATLWFMMVGCPVKQLGLFLCWICRHLEKVLQAIKFV